MILGTCNIRMGEHFDKDIDMKAHKARIKQMNLDFVKALDDEIKDEPNHYDDLGLRRNLTYESKPNYELNTVQYGDTFIETVKKAGTNPEYVLVHIHGGIFVKRLSEAFNPYLERLAYESDALVVAPDFRTAPNSTYEKGVDDVVNAYKYILSLGYDADHIVFYSESSGAAFAMSALLKIHELGLPTIKCSAFFCPYIGFDSTTESYIKYHDNDIVLSETMMDYVKKSLGLDTNPELIHKYFDFARKDLSGLPYLFTITGEEEIIKSEIIDTCQAAANYGVNSDIIIVKEMYHSFQHSSALKSANYYMNLMFDTIRDMMK